MAVSYMIESSRMLVRIPNTFTFAECQSFRKIVELVDNSEIIEVVVDFTDTTFIDSAALGMLLLLRDSIDQLRQTIILRNIHHQVERMVMLSRFDMLFLLERSQTKGDVI